jgi:hypothetical protein
VSNFVLVEFEAKENKGFTADEPLASTLLYFQTDTPHGCPEGKDGNQGRRPKHVDEDP